MRKYHHKMNQSIANKFGISCSRSTQITVAVLIILIIYFTTVDVYFKYETENPSAIHAISTGTSINKKCDWKLGDPVILNIKTKLGVSYKGGHWFHMSENLMTYHSILRNEYVIDSDTGLKHHSDRYLQIAHAREVYLNFDKCK